MRVIGLDGGLHDMAACLVEDGRPVSAIATERLTRVRHACDHEKLSACHRVLNTSFNVQGPIVETPADAVETFLRSEPDALVIGDHVLTRQAADLSAAPAPG